MKFENQNIPKKFKVLILAFFYFLAGYLSLKLAIFPGGITPVFPASGIAFVGIYFWGYRVWPGIIFGSIGIDYAVWMTDQDTGSFHPSMISMGIAVGATLQALFVVWSFKKFCDPPQFLNKTQSILWFIALPTGIGCLISPLLGTGTFYLSGFEEWDQFWIHISCGWLAESAGILLIVPIAWITFFKSSSIDFPKQVNVVEYFIFSLSLFIAGQIVFGTIIGNPHYPLVYSLFPFLVWAVFRFGPKATLITCLAICCFSIWGSLNEGGPFVGRSNFETLILLQAYCWFVMVTALVAIGAVTERVISEKKLKFEKARLKLITDKIPILISFIDQDCRYQFLNKAYENWFGMSQIEILGKKVKEVLGIDSFNKINPFIKGALEGIPQSFEIYIPHKSGESRYMSASYVPHFNPSEEIGGFFAFIQDLSERKKAEEEIAERERQLKSILDNTPAIVYMKDLQGRYLLINKKCEEILGVKNEEIIGKKAHEIVPREVAEQFLKNDREVVEKLGPIEVEEQIPYNGSFKTVYSVQFPLRNGKEAPYGICGISTDITERKIAEKKLQDYKDQLENLVLERTKELTQANQKLNEITNELQISEERTKFALEATTDGFWDWNLETDEVFFSDSWMKSLGFSPGELAPHLDTWKKLVRPEHMPKVMEALNLHLEGKTPFYQCENQLLTKFGSWRWNLDRGKVVKRDANGKPIRMVGSDTDITERKLAEEKLKKSQDQLVHMEKLSALGKLTGSIAHEFNNPIYGTKIILEQLRDEANLSDQQRKGLSLAIKECYRMTELIGKLRDFYQPTSKKREKVNIHNLLFDVLLLLKNRFKEKKIVIVNEFDESLPDITVVGDQIKQVFLNIIQNAEDAFIKPSINNRIRIRTESKGSNLYIRIQDNGVGILEEDIKNIFDPFFTTKLAVKGTGLGLSISHGIIKDHGGNIRVKSKLSKGSTFSIELPIKENENEKP